VYLGLLTCGLRRAYQVARWRRDRLALCALGVLLVMTFQWINGGQYSVAILPWFLLGWLDRERTEPNQIAIAEVAGMAPASSGASG
jgi:hypothetical protein